MRKRLRQKLYGKPPKIYVHVGPTHMVNLDTGVLSVVHQKSKPRYKLGSARARHERHRQDRRNAEAAGAFWLRLFSESVSILGDPRYQPVNEPILIDSREKLLEVFGPPPRAPKPDVFLI